MGGFFSALFGRPPAASDQVGAEDADNVDLDAPSSSELQVFVRISYEKAPPICLEVTDDYTVESVVYLALSRRKRRIFDFRTLYSNKGKSKNLYLEKSLLDQGVVSGSTITAMPRNRGGAGKTYLKLDQMSFVDRMNELPFKDEWLETKRSTYVLSKLGRQTFHKLFEMVSRYHALNKCFGGKFDCNSIIYVPAADSYMIKCVQHFNSHSPNVAYLTSDGYKKDIEALCTVLEKVCTMKLESLHKKKKIAYVTHLLEIMSEMPSGGESSETFKAFLRNHPCMMSAASRQGLILEVHRYIKFQHDPSMEPVLQSPYTWGWLGELEPDFIPVYLYNLAWIWKVRRTGYYEDERSWFTFCRNFLSHPHRNLTVQDADITIWWYFEDHLADFLCRLSCTHEFTHNIFDKDWFCTHPTLREEYQTCTFHFEEDPTPEHSEEETEHSRIEPEYEREPIYSGEEPSSSELGHLPELGRSMSI